MKAEGHARVKEQRIKDATPGSIEGFQGKIGIPFQIAPTPSFLEGRDKLFTQLYEKQELVAKELERLPIKVRCNEEEFEGLSHETTPFDILYKVYPDSKKKYLAAKIKSIPEENLEVGEKSGEWEIIDLNRRLTSNSEISFVDISSKEGQTIFWHSGAHILGEALETLYSALLCHGPPTQNGFFYDVYIGDAKLSQSNFKEIESAMKKSVSLNNSFERLILSKEEALELFKYNPFKVQLIESKILPGEITMAYRCGKIVDLCLGPHLPDSSYLNFLQLNNNSSSYWLGNEANDSLQRIYGVAFNSKDLLAKHKKKIKDAELRNHRKLGKDKDLYLFNDISPGSCFYYSDGATIYNQLMEWLRGEVKYRGYKEVLTPNIYNLKLWKTSGHYSNYKQNLFVFKVENKGFGMKPMNCPGHCVLFKEKIYSFRDLPQRWGEFGVLHRNELSGTLSGLFRVRRFVQDDAHIFCREDQVLEEILGCLDLADYIYSTFGLSYELQLSTRPEHYIGNLEQWNMAEEMLIKALNMNGKPWELNPGDGVFYGPKIDIHVKDALERPHQIGTVQVDFQLPNRFNLQYKTSDKKLEGEEAKVEKVAEAVEDPKSGANLQEEVFEGDEYDAEKFVWKQEAVKPGHARPVMIHRAILGSIERFLGVMMEHTLGKLPFWLSSRQIALLPISIEHLQYAEQIEQRLLFEGYKVFLDKSNASIDKKVRNAEAANYNYMFVIGQKELDAKGVDVRAKNRLILGMIKLVDLLPWLKAQNEPPASNAKHRYISGMWKSENESEDMFFCNELPMDKFTKTEHKVTEEGKGKGLPKQKQKGKKGQEAKVEEVEAKIEDAKTEEESK